MVPLLNGYCLMHVLETCVKLPYFYTGFALPAPGRPAVDYGRSSIRLRSPQYTSELTVIAQACPSFGFSARPANKCVVNKKTAVPWARSFLEKGDNEVITLAQAAGNDEYHPSEIVKNGDIVELSDRLFGKMRFIRSKEDQFYRAT